MNVIVTGGAGYIGAHLVESLLRVGHEVTIIDDFSTGHKSFVNTQAKLIEGSIEDSELIECVFSTLRIPDSVVVIHAAGLKYAGESVRHPLSFYAANTFSTLNLLKQMKKFNITKLIFSSSSSVYGDTYSNELLKEKFAVNPISPYGRSKYFSEQIIKDVANEFNLNYAVLRYFNVIGNSKISALDTSRFNLLPNIYRAIENKTHLQVFGGGYQTADGTCIRDYVDVVSLANAHCDFVKLLEKNESFPKIVNLASGVGHSILDIIRIVRLTIDKEFKFDVIEGRSGDPSSVIADCTNAKKFVGWNPNTNLDEIVLSGWEAWTR